MTKKLNIGFVGMSHLGLNYLAAASEKGFSVIGFDNDKDKIHKIKKRTLDLSEPNLWNLIKKNSNKIIFSDNFKNLKSCDLVFISQDIKTDKKGRAKLIKLKKLINTAILNIGKNAILIILSQVKPGFMRKIKFDKSRLYYQVETLVFGKAIERAINPERIIVGLFKTNSNIKSKYFSYLKKFSCPILKMKYESAELTKISINILLASTITSTNLLAEVCEKVSADWQEVVPALQLDERIGKKSYLKPGLGISGGNIERDIFSVREIIKNNDRPVSIINAFEKNSDYMKSWVYRVLNKNRILNKNSNICILGLSYKENTDSTKNSPTISLLKKIKNNPIKIYDPKAILKDNYKNCLQVKNMLSAIKNTNLIILMTPWNEFKNINKYFNFIKKKSVIIDPYRLIDFKYLKKRSFEYFTLGRQEI